MRDLWQRRQLVGKIVDITPSFLDLVTIQKPYFDFITRGDEILDWLTLNPTKQFVIIDDKDDFDKKLQPFYFQTQEDKGITATIADQIITQLNADWTNPFLENDLYKKTKGKKVLYFDIDGTFLDYDDIPKPAFLGGRLEKALEACHFDYYACVSGWSDMVAQRHGYGEKPSQQVQKERIWHLLQDIFLNKQAFLEKLILIYNTDRRGEYINLESNWYYVDDWADTFYTNTHGIAEYEIMIERHKIHLAQHDGNGGDILNWLGRIRPE